MSLRRDAFDALVMHRAVAVPRDLYVIARKHQKLPQLQHHRQIDALFRHAVRR